MNILLEQFFIFFNSEAGSVAYHFVLASSMIGALALILAQWEQSYSPHRKRCLLGLSLLFGMQLLLFLVAGLTWQGIALDETLLPPLDRVVTLLSLLLIVWLWAFPQKSSTADMLTALFAILIMIASIFGMLWWRQQGQGLFYNGSLGDILTQAGSLLITFTGGLLLSLRKPNGWQMGLSMLFLLSIGVIAHLLLLPYGENYPGLIRLTQIAAFPFLLLLPQSIHDSATSIQQSEYSTQTGGEKEKAAIKEHLELYESQLWQELLTLTMEQDRGSMEQAIAATLAKTTRSDICLVIEPPDSDNHISVAGGYHLHQQQPIESFTIQRRLIPILLSAFKLGRIRRISAQSDAPDAKAFASSLHLEKSGNMLIIPVLSQNGTPQKSFVLLSPFSQRDWSTETFSFLGVFSKVLVQFLLRCQQIADFKDELHSLKQNIRLINDQARQALDDSQKLRDMLAVLEEGRQRAEEKITDLTALAITQEKYQEQMKAFTKNGSALPEDSSKIEDEIKQTQNNLAGELKLALEEIAFLRTALMNAKEKISNLEKTHPQEIETTQPSLTSPNEKRSSLLNDESSPEEYTERQSSYQERKEVNLSALITSLVKKSREKDMGVTIALEMPKQDIYIQADSIGVQNLFRELLVNAGAVTPQGETINLSIQLEEDISSQQMALVKIKDKGSGFNVWVLSDQPDELETEQEISGISLQLRRRYPNLKTFIESVDGMIWVESEPQMGAAYHVLLPFLALQDQRLDFGEI